MKTVITFGTFDLFHVGHLNILRRSAELGDRLVVGVSTDELNLAKKGRAPVYCTQERMMIIAALDCVDEVFIEESLERKRDYILQFSADILVMGDDWRGHFDSFKQLCDVHYLPRTQGISTTDVVARIRKYA
ncbi:adenylyltransferase/cytidyltransferase family protein [Maritimibacter fusiformis]|uniref:Adenylyltransferase/cytidyltransferase family protein n=1 Tax=Maritimibacter fusiformis TaxID=2603819 RepID=A0A5D0RNH0_9RHOB|nr:adenylyltransferase/cytidyltransferase family protein [Maritimibacter fusiformis]TYB82124.1 adenylyltransferase/cytidyltransferase family protein [Maritimibacter fusiformis]